MVLAVVLQNPFEEKREPKRYRTGVLLLTNLTPYREAKAAHSRTVSLFVDFNVPSNAQSRQNDLANGHTNSKMES